jgi:intracellular sulfur oxidation DsrE/DsrF family protein
LQAEPDTKIVVVTNGEGMRFLLTGARDRNGKLFDESVAALAERGVAFRVCSNTLVAYQVPESRLLPQAKIVTSGVVEASRLQAREGYAYLRP